MEDQTEEQYEPTPQSDYIGVVVGRPSDISRVGQSVNIFKRKELDIRAQTAADFVSRWGMVAAVPDGEDSTGRQKLRLATEAELVLRAVTTVGILFDAIEEMEWFIHLPDLAEMASPTGGMTPPTDQKPQGGITLG